MNIIQETSEADTGWRPPRTYTEPMAYASVYHQNTTTAANS